MQFLNVYLFADGFDTDGSTEGQFKKNSPDDYSEAGEGSSRSSVELMGKQNHD